VEAGWSVYTCCPTATTGQLERRPDRTADEECKQTDQRKHQVAAASAPSRFGNQRRETGTRRLERRLRHQ
jgi:hypothetical protein